MTTERTIIFDVETHDRHEPRIIESAWMDLDPLTLEPISPPDHQWFNPETNIAFGAMATHHILPHELENCPSYTTFSLPKDVKYVVGHNVGFDLQAAGADPEQVCGIDTLALARGAWPTLDSHTQSALFYMLASRQAKNTPSMSAEIFEQARDVLRQAHGAATDIRICSRITQALVMHYRALAQKLPALGCPEPNEPLAPWLYRISELTKVLMTMPFGKHKGERPWEVPDDYKRWYLRQDNVDLNVLFSMHRGNFGPNANPEHFELALSLFGPQAKELQENEPDGQAHDYSNASAPERQRVFSF